MFNKIDYCKSCGHQVQGVCNLQHRKVSLTDDFCSLHSSRIKTEECDCCHQLMLAEMAILIVNDEAPIILCPSCYDAINTCPTCSAIHECKFETDPSPIPKQVMHTVRQGNMVMQTQIMNPERVKITCMTGCPCFDEENIKCNRQDGTCSKYKWRVGGVPA